MEIEKKIVEILKEIIEEPEKADGLDVKTDLLESELLDSLGIAQLVAELEDAFEIGEIDGEDILPENFESVEKIAELIRRYEEKAG